MILRTDSNNSDFQELVKKLDQILAVLDGEDHTFYDQFNQLDDIKNTVVFYAEGDPVACGAIKRFDEKSAEIKRMFTDQKHRGKGYASQVLDELENWARELGYVNCILETGINQTEAIRLYQKNNYSRIENYGPYKGVENSFCFCKKL